MNSKNVLVLNDTRRETGHHGCLVVMQALKALCIKNNMVVAYSMQSIDPMFYVDLYVNILENIDIVIVNGEGTLHDNAGIGIFKRCQVAKELGKQVVLINAVWQNNSETCKYLDYFDHIYTRESLSEVEIRKQGYVYVDTVPDLSFYFYGRITPAIDSTVYSSAVVTDSVSKEHSKQLLDFAFENDLRFYYMSPYHFHTVKALFPEKDRKHNDALISYLDDKCALISDMELLNSSRVITGRFHVACFCICAGRQVLALPSNTHKIEGMLNDCKLNVDKYMIDSADIYGINIASLPTEEKYRDLCREYTNMALKKIEHTFAEISSFPCNPPIIRGNF